MKKIIIVLVLLFVARVSAGYAYDRLSNRGKVVTENSTGAAEEQAEPAASPVESTAAADEAAPVGKARRVSNPDKICSTPGCGRAVFVTYKGKELCVKCYGEAKIRDTEHQ